MSAFLVYAITSGSINEIKEKAKAVFGKDAVITFSKTATGFFFGTIYTLSPILIETVVDFVHSAIDQKGKVISIA